MHSGVGNVVSAMKLDHSLFLTETESDVNEAMLDHLRQFHDQKMLPEPMIIRKAMGDDNFNLNHYTLGNQRGDMLAEMLPQLPSVRSLSLRNNRLSGRSIEHMLQSACSIRVLQHLDISENRLGRNCIVPLAQIVSDCKFLQAIVVQNCHIDAAMGKDLALRIAAARRGGEAAPLLLLARARLWVPLRVTAPCPWPWPWPQPRLSPPGSRRMPRLPVSTPPVCRPRSITAASPGSTFPATRWAQMARSASPP